MADGTANIGFPLFTSSSGNWANVDWPLFTTTTTGVAGNNGTANIDVSLFSVASEGNANSGDVDWKLFSVDGTGATGLLGTVDANWALFTQTGTGITGETGTLDRPFNLFSVTATGKTRNAASIDWTLFTLTGSGGESSTADEAIDWPLFTVVGSGQSVSDAVTTSDYVVWVVNTDTGAHSTYENWLVNSMQEFNGATFVSTPDGIYELTGDDDAGTDIDASIYWPPTKLGTSKQKRIDSVYTNVRLGGDFELVVTTDEKTRRIYGIDMSGDPDNMHNRRVVLTRGLQGQIWQFGFENVDGSDFDLSENEVVPINLSRRIK